MHDHGHEWLSLPALEKWGDIDKGLTVGSLLALIPQVCTRIWELSRSG